MAIGLYLNEAKAHRKNLGPDKLRLLASMARPAAGDVPIGIAKSR